MQNKKQVLYQIGLAALKAVAAIIVAVVVIGYVGKKVEGLSAALAKQRAASLVLEEKNEIVSGLRRDLAKVGNGEAKINSAFPQTDNLVEFKSALATIAANNALIDNSSVGDPADNGDGFATVPFSLTISGNLAKAVTYLKTFEKLPYFTPVSGLSITSQSSPWDAGMTVGISARLFAQIPPQ